MEAKEFLKQVRKIELLIENKEAEIEKAKMLCLINFTNGKNEALEKKLNQYKNEISDSINLLIDKKKEIQNVIDRLSEADLIDILYKRYFQFETWEKIATDKYFTFQWLHKLHARALKEVQAILDEVKE